MKNKIIIDLDVVTVALWDNRGKNAELARKFLARVSKKEFYLGTPSLIIGIVLKWKHEILKNRIKEFFIKNSDSLITDTEIKEKIDAALVLIASIFSFDYLVTFNKIHLKNKKEEANKILKEWKLPTIQISGPEEL